MYIYSIKNMIAPGDYSPESLDKWGICKQVPSSSQLLNTTATVYAINGTTIYE